MRKLPEDIQSRSANSVAHLSRLFATAGPRKRRFGFGDSLALMMFGKCDGIAGWKLSTEI